MALHSASDPCRCCSSLSTLLSRIPSPWVMQGSSGIGDGGGDGGDGGGDMHVAATTPFPAVISFAFYLRVFP